MFDIHNHTLPTVDDGSSSMEISLQMINMAIEDGITHILLTPHAINMGQLYKSKAHIKEKFDAFIAEAGDKGITFLLGSEIYITGDFFKEFDNDMYHTLNDSKYVLIEFSLFEEQEGMIEFIYTITARGLVPIIAHPERYSYINLNHVMDMKNVGALIQINALSLTGQHGRKAKRFAHRLLKKRLADFVASDAHDLTKRPPKLKPTRLLIENKYGKELADKLFVTNPYKLLKRITE